MTDIVDLVTEAMLRVNKETIGLRFTELVREMARVAVEVVNSAATPPEVIERRRKGLSDYERSPLGQPPSRLQEQEPVAAALPDANDHVTRRNPEMEKYVEIAPAPSEDCPDGCRVYLTVAHQRFTIAHNVETRKDAEWMRDMVCIALAKIVAENKEAT